MENEETGVLDDFVGSEKVFHGTASFIDAHRTSEGQLFGAWLIRGQMCFDEFSQSLLK